ncbi:uncharacterized protein LOC132734083 [Ruditapes philippinarum]|uniref:uncharacterized protein LOC132734083 n=1 Tax=Ruditapes philippinarum TaxID=129788 RepID=UPI00295B6B81|nr:uncharacterized protein LOC132734083 [Ruditapes philippinarum]
MRKARPVLTFLLFLCTSGVHSSTLYQWIVDSQTRFNYDPNPNNMLGVYNWPRTYSSDCGGENQSPVDIQTDLVRYGVSCQCPRMIYNSNILRGKFKNNGHSAEFEPEDERMLQLTNVPYRSGMYKLHDFHLHYGGVTGRDFELQGLRFRGSGIMSAGSEHTIDGLRFEGELHFVFYNSNYKDLEEADNKTDGVVVIVIMIQKIPGGMSNSGETSRFSEFLEMNIPRIFPYQANASTEVDLTMFFNRDCEFYTYAGSTTTPTCHESVRWIILKDPIMVTEQAWFSLTGLQSRGDFNSRFGNYRTTQPLNQRVIEANFDRPSGTVRPSPNGEAIMMMMLDLMNMTMEMMAQESNPRSTPMMLMDRNALSPVGNVRDMPLMMMSMMQNANVPNLNGQMRDMPMMMPMQMEPNMPMLNENVRDMPIMSMMQMNRDGNVPNLNGNVRDRPMQGPINMPNVEGNIRQMQMMMSRLNNPNIPNVGGSMASIQMPIQDASSAVNIQDRPMMMRPTLNSPMIPNLVDVMSQRMEMVRNSNVPNLDGNVRGRGPMPEPNMPVFNRDVFRMLTSVMGSSRDGPNLDGNVRRMQRPAFMMSPTANQQQISTGNRNNNNNNNGNMNNNNNNNNESGNMNNNNNNNSNRMNDMNNNMMNTMKNMKSIPWNVWR